MFLVDNDIIVDCLIKEEEKQNVMRERERERERERGERTMVMAKLGFLKTTFRLPLLASVTIL